MAEWITAKGDGRTPATFEFLLAFRASAHCLCQEGFKIVDVKVNVNRRPVSLIATNVIGPLGRFASSRLLNQSDLGVSAIENDVCRDGPGDLGKPQGVAIKSQAFIKSWDVNGN